MTYIVILIIYLIFQVVIGYAASRGVKDSDDWAVAGRSLGVIESSASYFTTILSAVSFVGYMGYYYNNGWGGWWNWAGSLISTILFAAYFGARLRRFGGVTMSDFLEERYGKPHALMAAVLILFSTILFTMAQLVASGSIIQVVTGIPSNISVIIVGIVFIFFTMTGGSKSVAWTSIMTSALILLGTFALMFAVLDKTGGFWNLQKTLLDLDPKYLSPWAGGSIKPGMALSWCITWGLGNFGLPQIMTKFNSCRDEKVVRMSQGVSGILFMFFYLPLMIIGLGIIVLKPGIENVDTVASIAMLEMVHPILGGVVLSAIIGAAISTASAVLLSAGTTATRDIYTKYINKDASEDKVLKISRATTLAVGILAIILSILSSSTVLFIQANMVGVLGSMLAMTMIIGLTWKRSNYQGGLAGMLVGITTAIVWYIIGTPFGWNPILPSVFTSSIANIVASLMTAPPSEFIVNKFFGNNEVV